METNHPEPAPRKKSWGKRIAIGGIAIAALAGVGVAGALSQDYERMQSFGMGWGGPGMHMQANFRHGMGFGGLGGHHVERMLDEIDATPEQEKKLEAIMDKLHDDVRPIMRGFRDTRDDVAKLLGAATIDREAAEKLRAERVAAVDEASRKLTTALLDAADVLTAEQRAELAEHFEDRGWHRRW
ncbi:Spy/CpxP family protein refolding chaperone [Mesorhizobium sp.]|uniref:Spy/CpxP family protein refolding chaperone n=1 Tax=Mesorhizobium sp. TaxID=1871066 RepID=UPI000FE6DC40|nr:Spy/CpxP family protein refolding chaperone [Mesorhizobium sp.]RWI29405.1 MAG: periplasmic heavy metal sensor [Mesorhizobium sp.]RWK49358.1 MAG: periplasmic heavy metal sensor [Mesorhizobium sp.]RWK95030.1 MAG: periplasmic heavy metal sensor [Mesorhizobium sp.]RWK97429.1 MAG: periplasmic heavy metal sensor [Mesorhizobium sp.]TIP56751.1 MAG: periplasmic heavy metal sensor [Mesorhizobium sp.]